MKTLFTQVSRINAKREKIFKDITLGWDDRILKFKKTN